FMGRTAATAAAGVAGVAGLDCSSLGKSGSGEKGIKYVKLGRTGMRVSRFLGDRMADAKMYELALDAGVNYWHKFGTWVDPAPYDLFRKRDRDSFYCDAIVHAVDYDKSIETFQASLSKCGLEYIDGFKVHSMYKNPEDVRAQTGVIRAFETLKKQGKTKYLMLSQHTNVPDVFEAAIESDLFDLIQIPVNPMIPRRDVFDYKAKDENPDKTLQDRYFGLIKKAAGKDIAVTAMKVFLYGTKNWQMVPDLKERVKKYLPDNQSIAKALIHYALDIPGVVAYGSMLYSFEELQENLEANGGKLTTAERKGLRIFREAMNCHYCRMCGACEQANPGGVEVSSVMRFRGYSLGFDQHELSRAAYAALPAQARVDAAGDFESYERACPYGLPVANLLRDTHTMLA
ncbi:MAG: aldo/keto reductase, partial [Candidatus Latescibacterota bacterium]